MKEFVEKLIERLEEYKYTHLVERDSERLEHCKENEKDCEGNDCFWCVWDKATEIVKDLAEEHNNGWIPCSERMPEYEKEMYLVQTAYGLMDVLRFTKDAYKLDKYDFYEYKNKKKAMFYDHDSEYGYAEVDVLAWHKLPAPYKKGE